MVSKQVKVNRLSTNEINKATAFLDSEIRALKERVKEIENEDLYQIVKEISEELFETLAEDMIVEILEDKLDLEDLAEKISIKITDKLSRL